SPIWICVKRDFAITGKPACDLAVPGVVRQLLLMCTVGIDQKEFPVEVLVRVIPSPAHVSDFLPISRGNGNTIETIAGDQAMLCLSIWLHAVELNFALVVVVSR